MLELNDEEAMCRFGAELAAVAETGDLICLTGPLGAGKTVLARAFIRALAGADETVPSPTYTLLQVYENGRVPVYHFDLYRVRSEGELLELGFEEALVSGITLVEWPDRLPELQIETRLDIFIDHVAEAAPDTRTVAFTPCAGWARRIEELSARWETGNT